MPEQFSVDDADDRIDQLLRRSLRAESPQLSSAFDQRLELRIHPRGLNPRTRIVLGLYGAAALAASAWALSDLPLGMLAVVAVFTLVSPTMLLVANRRHLWSRGAVARE